MILRSGKGCNDPKNLEWVLPVLDRRLDDGGNGGVVLDAGFSTEAAADLELGFGRTQGLLAVVVRWRKLRIRQEGEDVGFVFCDAFLELVELGLVTVLLFVERRSGEQFVKPLLHFHSHFLSCVPLVPAVDGVPQEIHHVEAPCIVGKGLHCVSEVSQKVGYAYLVIIHPDFAHEVGRPSVRHPRLSAELLRGEIVVDDIVATALVECKISRNRILEGPEPVVLAVDIDPCLVRSCNRSVCHLFADNLVRSLGKLPHGVQHIGHGTLAYVKSEYGLKKMCEPLEGDVLIGAQIGDECGNVRAKGHRRIDRFGKQPFAAMSASALHLHLKMVYHLGGNGERNVDHLPGCAHRGGVHVQRLSANRADGRREPALRICGTVRLKPCASSMPILSASLLPGRLALGLGVRDAYWILGRRHTAVGACLDDLPGINVLSGLEFGYFGLLFGYFNFLFGYFSLKLVDFSLLTGNVPVQRIIDKRLFVKFLGNLPGAEIFGVSHLSEKLPASPCEFYPLSLKALFEASAKVLFHASKLRIINGTTKFNLLYINSLNGICKPFAGMEDRLQDGWYEKTLGITQWAKCDDRGHITIIPKTRKSVRWTKKNYFKTDNNRLMKTPLQLKIQVRLGVPE